MVLYAPHILAGSTGVKARLLCENSKPECGKPVSCRPPLWCTPGSGLCNNQRKMLVVRPLLGRFNRTTLFPPCLRQSKWDQWLCSSQRRSDTLWLSYKCSNGPLTSFVSSLCKRLGHRR